MNEQHSAGSSDTPQSALEFVVGVAKDERHSDAYVGIVVRSWLYLLERLAPETPALRIEHKCPNCHANLLTTGSTQETPEKPQPASNERAEHELKIASEFFDAVDSGRKPFEIRKGDRPFKIGDTLWLREVGITLAYTGREMRKQVTFCLRGWGMESGYVALGLAPHGNETDEYGCTGCRSTPCICPELGTAQETTVAHGPAHLRLSDSDLGQLIFCMVECRTRTALIELRQRRAQETVTKPTRDVDHCDYPDCEQHWTAVVAQARAILEPLAEHDPAVRKWLRTADLPPAQETSALPHASAALTEFMAQLGEIMSMEDGATPADYLQRARDIREWCHDHQSALNFVDALKIAESVFEQYHKDQPKWWKRMDGTPILNDVAVRMAEAFRDAASPTLKASCAHNNQRQGQRGRPYCADCGEDVNDRELSASETASFDKALARSPRRVDGKPPEPHTS